MWYIWIGNLDKTVIKSFDGTNWNNVGNVGFLAEVSFGRSLAFSPIDSEPYVAYQDFGYQGKTSVMRFDGTNWADVGNAGFSETSDVFQSLAFSPSGQPYVAYEDGGNSDKATVMYYDAPAGINELKGSRLSVNPNPATDRITVETTVSQANWQLSIMNLNGKEVLTLQITETKTIIDISNLPSGVYFVRLTNEKTVEVGKFVKQ